MKKFLVCGFEIVDLAKPDTAFREVATELDSRGHAEWHTLSHSIKVNDMSGPYEAPLILGIALNQNMGGKNQPAIVILDMHSPGNVPLIETCVSLVESPVRLPYKFWALDRFAKSCDKVDQPIDYSENAGMGHLSRLMSQLYFEQRKTKIPRRIARIPWLALSIPHGYSPKKVVDMLEVLFRTVI